GDARRIERAVLAVMLREVGVAIAGGDTGSEVGCNRPVEPRHKAAALRVDTGDTCAGETGEIADSAEPAAELRHRVGQLRDRIVQMHRAAIESELCRVG